MRRIFIGTLVVLTIALINGCANRKITRVDPNETIDLSGRWNDSDSRLVSEEMIGDLLTSAWIPRYLKANDKRYLCLLICLSLKGTSLKLLIKNLQVTCFTLLITSTFATTM